MFESSKTLRRASTIVAAASVLLGLPTALGASVANAAVPFNSTLQFQGCPFKGTDDPVADASSCATQATVNTSKPLTVTYIPSSNGESAAGQVITFEVGSTPAESNAESAPPGTNSSTASFSTAQPSQTQTQPGGNIATCTTDSAGKCTANLTDPNAETVYVNVYPGSPGNPTGDSATIRVDILPGSVAPARVSLTDQQSVCPTGFDGCSDIDDAIPGIVQQLQIQVTAVSGAGGSGATVDCNNPPPTSGSCTGAPLSGQSVTLNVDHGFFTNNCQGPATNVANNGQQGGPATPNPQGTANNYADCSFTTTPAKDVPVGNLKSNGTSTTVTTDANGYATVSVAIGRDAGFDGTGVVLAHVTATIGGASFTLRNAGDNNTGTGSGCSSESTVDQTEPGCNAIVFWTTQEMPLNGGSLKLVPLGTTLSKTSTNFVPDSQSVIFVLDATDQFGNLVSDPFFNGSGDWPDPAQNSIDMTRTGHGDLALCDDYNASNPCVTPTSVSAGTLQTDGTFTQTTTGEPSLNANLGPDADSLNGGPIDEQVRYILTPYQSGSVGSNVNGPFHGAIDDGSATVSATWHAPVFTFASYTAATASPAADAVATYSPYTTSTPKDMTDTFSVTFYNQLAQPVVTFSTTPSNRVHRGTVVTVSATVVDQHGQPIQGLNVQFLRGGSNESSCTPTYPNGYKVQTNAQGKAGFSFTCSAAGTSNVTVIVSDGSGNELARGTQSVTFTAPKRHVSASIHCSSPRRHVLRCVVHVSPRLAGLTVVFKRVTASGTHRIAVRVTNINGVAKLVKKHLKSGKHWTVKAHVRSTSTTTGANTGTSSATIK